MSESICANCSKKGNFWKCSACRSVSYCSVACQRQDWPKHKPNCQGKTKEKEPAAPARPLNIPEDGLQIEF